MAKSEQLKSLRTQIEQIDLQLFELLRQRVELVRQISELKKRDQQNVQDIEREQELLRLYQSWQPNLPERYLQIMQNALLEISYLEHRRDQAD